VAERPDPHPTVIRVRGDQDLSNVSALADALARATELGGADVVVDLSGVTFMDASTLGAIVRARHVLESRSRSLIVRCPSPCARRLLDLCGIRDLVDPEGTTAPARTRATVSRGPGVTARRPAATR
jgi:anti-sigma B factor antagonist